MAAWRKRQWHTGRFKRETYIGSLLFWCIESVDDRVHLIGRQAKLQSLLVERDVAKHRRIHAWLRQHRHLHWRVRRRWIGRVS